MVHESAVLAHEMADRRTTLSALVALRGGAAEDARALQDHVKQALMPHKYPRRIVFVPELPKTGTGKIDRKAVADMLHVGG
jgi:acyl-coenzyme A synthetase/AMP-(fatty) acid ligase